MALALFRPQHSKHTCEGAIVEYVVRVANPLVHGVSFVPGHVPRLLVHPVVLHQQLVERFSDRRGTTRQKVAKSHQRNHIIGQRMTNVLYLINLEEKPNQTMQCDIIYLHALYHSCIILLW